MRQFICTDRQSVGAVLSTALKISILVTAWLCARVSVAQENEPIDREWFAELGEELKISERHRDRAERELKFIEERIDILKGLRKSLAELGELERRLEKAEGSGDESAIETAEDQLTRAELELGRLETFLQWHDRRNETFELLRELEEEGPEPTRQRLIKLLDEFEQARDWIDQRFDAVARDDESLVDELDERIGKFEFELDGTLEKAHLNLRLFWAREEGEDDLIEELEGELEALDEEMKSMSTLEQGANQGLVETALPLELSEVDFEAVQELSFSGDIVPKLNHLCMDCHHSTDPSGNFDLSKLISETPLVINRKHWLKIVEQIKADSMPPSDEQRPKEQDRRLIAAWLTNAIENFDYNSVRRVGFEPARRMTRDEYNNTIRDLIGVDLRPADRFPTDLAASSGFRNSANSLFFQTVTLERFVGAADYVVEQAFAVDASAQQNGGGWEKLLRDDPSLSQPEGVIRQFSSLAFRRPVAQDELIPLVNVFDAKRRKGSTKREAMQAVVRAVLVSPLFLFRYETPESGKPLDDYELASRLSYFLWASMPDETLFELAAEGRLSEPDILQTQVSRMLRDPRSETLGSLFASQWLGTEHLDRIRPDQIDNPWATDTLVDSMKDETARFFHHLVLEDLPIERMIDADFTFVNSELADHYKLDGVRGEELRKVSIGQSSRRGILGHASILAITSFPGRVSPVMRGNWILSDLLGTPPPSPPPNVSQFEERVAENERLSQREKLQLHRQNPNCYACHSQIDPLGFALSEFDWFGRQRRERLPASESEGVLTDGTKVQGLKGLSEAIIDGQLNHLSRQLTVKMLTYALGRQLEYYDEATIRELLKEFEANQRQLQSLIHAIVQSDTFQKSEPGQQFGPAQQGKPGGATP